IDDGSLADYQAKIPREDSRVSFIRYDTPRGWSACVRAGAGACGSPDDIVFPLSGRNWLPDDDVLATVSSLVHEYDCAVLYGQHGDSRGRLGGVQPLLATPSLTSSGSLLSPLLFRAGLMERVSGAPGDEEATNRALLHAAGCALARFCDHVLLVVNRDSP